LTKPRKQYEKKQISPIDATKAKKMSQNFPEDNKKQKKKRKKKYKNDEQERTD